MRYLKDKPVELPEAFMFVTGLNEWRRHSQWPPKDAKPMTFWLHVGERLQTAAPTEERAFEYISDPNRPTPHLGYITRGFTSDYMTEDQRFAAQRPDVLVYKTCHYPKLLRSKGGASSSRSDCLSIGRRLNAGVACKRNP